MAMPQERLHRLPVVNNQQGLVGILSTNDVLLQAEKARKSGISYDDVVQTLQAICAHTTRTVHAMAH
jgi:CBS-domain-containing membrane protein